MKTEIKFKPAIVSTYDEFKVDINKLITILEQSKSEYFLYCQSFDHGDMQFLPVTYEEVYNSDDYNLYKQNMSTNNFQIGVMAFSSYSEHNYTTIYALLSVLQHKTSDFLNHRR